MLILSFIMYLTSAGIVKSQSAEKMVSECKSDKTAVKAMLMMGHKEEKMALSYTESGSAATVSATVIRRVNVN